MKTEHLVAGVIISAQTLEYLLNTALQRVVEENQAARSQHDIETSVITERVHSFLYELSDNLGNFLNDINSFNSGISAVDFEIVNKFNEV